MYTPEIFVLEVEAGDREFKAQGVYPLVSPPCLSGSQNKMDVEVVLPGKG